MRFESREATSVAEFVSQLANDVGTYGGPIWFRGQSDATWKLEPKLLRTNTPPPESHLVSRFKQSAAYLLANPPSAEFDWLFLMQHHGVPTRLLDWSENALTAAYFACNQNLDRPGTIWALLPCELNKRANYAPDFIHEIPAFDDDLLKNYLPSHLASEKKTRLNPIAGIAVRNSTRMHAQQGVFTISHRDNIRLDEVAGSPEHDYLWRYDIPAASKPAIASQLRLIGISHFQLFPELGSIAENLS
jgi:hypothetical protein